MDVKDIIKWLCQLKNMNNNIKNSVNTNKNISAFYSIFFLLAILLVNVSPCNSNNLNPNNKSSLINSVSIVNNVNYTKNSRDNKTGEVKCDTCSLKATREIQLKRLFESEEKRKEFAPYSGVIRLLRDGARYLDRKLEENVGKETARTFGRPIKKLQAMMIPLMFKLGVLSTLIVLTFLLALKAVVIGKALLFLKIAAVLGKLALFKGHESSPDEHSPEKQVHVHIHNSPSAPGSISYPISGGHSQGWSSHHEPWSRLDPYSHQYNANAAAYGAHDPARLGVSNLNSPYGAQDPLKMGVSIINTPFGRYVRTGAPTAPAYIK